MLQASTYALLYWRWSVFPRLVPANPGELQSVLWQVDAALVAVALPVALVTVQYSVSLHGNIAALPVSEVLRKVSVPTPVLLVAGIGLIKSGADAIWFQSSAVLLMDFVLVFLVTVFLVGYSFISLFSAINSQDVLKHKAEQLLKSKLDDAVDESWALGYANQLLIERIASTARFKVAYTPLVATFIKDSEEWLVVSAETDGEVVDIQVDRLRSVIEVLPARVSPLDSDTHSSNPTAAREEATDVFLAHKIADRIQQGSPLLALRRDRFEDLDAHAIEADVRESIRIDS
jgi:hypothetical protein